MRGDTKSQIETSKNTNCPIHLVKIELGCSDSSRDTQHSCEFYGGKWTPPIFMTNWAQDVTWDSNEYLAVGHFMGLKEITETSALTVSSINLTLSAIDKVWGSLILNTSYVYRPITVYRGFVDRSGTLITTPFEMFRGILDNAVMLDGEETATIVLTAKSHLADFDRKSGRRTNNAEMNRYFPGDTSFQYASSGLKEIKWGSE